MKSEQSKIVCQTKLQDFNNWLTRKPDTFYPTRGVALIIGNEDYKQLGKRKDGSSFNLPNVE
jgi:hypothetical protein